MFGHVLTQMSAKAAIKKHGSATVDAMMAEFAMLQNMSVYRPLDPTKLTPKQKRNDFLSINLIKEKHRRRRSPAKGSLPEVWHHFPNGLSDGLLLSLLIDSYEGRDVATADVVGAYLRAYMDEEVIMKFSGEFVDILLGTKPEYEEFVVYKMELKIYTYYYLMLCTAPLNLHYYGTSFSLEQSRVWVLHWTHTNHVWPTVWSKGNSAP
jgi:hypothetical protein